MKNEVEFRSKESSQLAKLFNPGHKILDQIHLVTNLPILTQTSETVNPDVLLIANVTSAGV